MNSRPIKKLARINLRTVFGVALVLIGVLGTFLLISAFQPKDVVYIADRDLWPGEQIRVSSLDTSNLNLGGSQQQYLMTTDDSEFFYAKQFIAAGELIPKKSISDAVSGEFVVVSINPSNALPSNTKAGDLVDIWAVVSTEILIDEAEAALGFAGDSGVEFAAEDPDGQAGFPGQFEQYIELSPRVIVPAAQVVALVENTGFGQQGLQRVEVQIARVHLAQYLLLLDQGIDIQVIGAGL